MCEKAVNAFLSALKFVPDGFVTKKMIKKLDDNLFANNDIIFVKEDSNYVTFSRNEMGILSVDISNIDLDDINFDEDDPETIIHVRLTAWHNSFKQRKTFKKELSKEIISLAWHSNKMVGMVPEDEEKEMKPFFIDEK